MAGKKKLLITGGLGNLGSWLTYYFTNKFDVYVLSKRRSHKLKCDYTLIECDITDIESLEEKLTMTFDYCIHTASYNEFFHEEYAEKALNINALGTRNLVEVLSKTPIENFIYLSTFHVYGANDGIVTEETDLRPKNDYASTHLFAEYYLKQFQDTKAFPLVIFRLTNSYGTPSDINSNKWYLLLNDLVKSSYENNKIILKSNGKAKRDFIWMEDVCSVIEESLSFESSIENVFNLSSEQVFSVLDLAEKVRDVYTKRYNKEVAIVTNREDLASEKFLEVSNKKLSRKISFEFSNKLTSEIEQTFNLLEQQNR